MRHSAIAQPAALLLALGALAGCSSTHQPVTATSGVYDLTIAGERDACSPVRATGPAGLAGVVQQGALLTVTVPDLTTSSPMLVTLASDHGFTDGRTDALTACSAASLVRTYSVVAHDANGFDVAYTESWTGMSTCGAAMHAIMPAAPTADCTADLVLHYQLETPCDAPCEIRLGVGGTAACHC